MRPWSTRKRSRYLALARWLDRLATRIRARVRAHTPRRALRKPRLVSAA